MCLQTPSMYMCAGCHTLPSSLQSGQMSSSLSKHILNEEIEETICSYQYDEKGRLKQTICTAKDNTDFYLEMNIVYKLSGKVETIKTKTDVISKKVFDENGLLKLHRTSEFDHKYRYSFDRKGNWKEVVLYENGIPTKIRVRKIEYY